MNFEYNSFKIPGAKFKISPSSIGKFFDNPVLWFRENALGEKNFIASTSTVLGSIVHNLAETYVTKEPQSREECNAYIDQMAKESPDVDPDEVKTYYPGMASLLINDYVKDNLPTKVEEAIYTEVKDGIYIGGSCDAFYHSPDKTNGMVLDYKTAGKKPNTETIPFGYKIQALAYAKCYEAQGYTVDRIRIVYCVRPTKTLPERLFVVTQQITEEDWELIDNTLELMADSILYSQEHPETIPLIFKSQKLKGITWPKE